MGEQAITGAAHIVSVSVAMPPGTVAGTPSEAELSLRLRLHLRDAHGRSTPLVRIRPVSARSSTDSGSHAGADGPAAPAAPLVVRFAGIAAPGGHLLCADPVGGLHHFPPRTVHIDGPSQLHFELIRRDLPFFRRGCELVTYQPEQGRLALVLHDADVDPGTTERLVAVLAGHRYHRVIDLTRRSRRGIPGDETVLEFAPSHRAAVDAGRLIRAAADLARRADVPPGSFRLGRVVGSGDGRVVLDNQCVVGFAAGVDIDTATRHVNGSGGRIIEDLTDPDGHGLILVIRFDGTDPEAALARTERLLAAGALQWAEPNLVEH